MKSTGEGGVSSHHLMGGDLVWQIGTGYFGCREQDGRFSMAKLKETIARCPQIRAIEVKLSQGAKPGVGGLLPKAKITQEIADIRCIPIDRDCISPACHSTFRNADEMLDFVELIASETGLPVGIKSAVGDSKFWEDLARLMVDGARGVDFITIDGGEGGTGAGPLVFTDHVTTVGAKSSFSDTAAGSDCRPLRIARKCAASCRSDLTGEPRRGQRRALLREDHREQLRGLCLARVFRDLVRRARLFVEHLPGRVRLFITLPRNLGDDGALEDVDQHKARVVVWRADTSGRVVDVADRHFPVVHRDIRQVVFEDRRTRSGRWRGRRGLRLGRSQLAGRDELGKQRERSNGVSAVDDHGPRL